MIKEIIFSFLTGLTAGGLFALFRLPIPAPSTIAGMIGVIGVFIGFIVVKHFRG